VTGRSPPSQADFAAALLDPGRALRDGLRTWNGSDPAVRLAVHRNNVVVSLVQALADGFPVVKRLVGDEFFAVMAGIHVRAQPPRSPVLAEYGDGLADWLATFEPAAALPYLPDMARLERARVRAHHATDTAALPADVLAARLQAAGGLERVRLGLHAAITTIASDWAVASLWAAHQHETDDAIAQVHLDQAEAALVLREGDEVLVLPVGHADAVFVQSLQAALPLGAAVEAATAAAAAGPPFDLAATLSLLIRHGCITACHPPGDIP
jgi:hypothetical protein